MSSARFHAAAQLDEGPRRVAALAAWVQSLSGPGGAVPVLVGGGAVELYSGGAYRTDDLDFVGLIGEDVARQLLACGFLRKGRHWVHEARQVFLEFPSAQLSAGATAARIDFGDYSVLVIGLEELIVDRLAAWLFWRSEIDGVNAFLLLRHRAVDIERRRLDDLATAAEVGPALEALDRFLAGLESREPESAELEQWARSISMADR